MHVAPADLRAVRQGPVAVRFTLLGSMVFALAEIPPGGGAGTSFEAPCSRAHWGLVVAGQIRFVTPDAERVIPAGRVFHVPAGGPDHHFESSGPAVVGGFQPVEDPSAVAEGRLASRGFELLTAAAPPVAVPPIGRGKAGPGEVRSQSWSMPPYLLTRVTMGEGSGYTAGWCDAPHWGLVTHGRLAIEWEDDVELLSAGDVFHCPAGPPGHRIQAADPVAYVDLTPLSAFRVKGRLDEWHRTSPAAARTGPRRIAVAALG